MARAGIYDFMTIEKKWQSYWQENRSFRARNKSNLPKYYALDMFPYPSGRGLHVGHPLGYLASDIVVRYKRSLGYNVLRPMGFDAFGLPAEQYAREVGQHPKVTTAVNIARYRKQLESLGLAIDWERTICTADPAYYRWTQWIFLQLFDSWYDKAEQRARPISELVDLLGREGSSHIKGACGVDTLDITAGEWLKMDEGEKERILLHYRLAFLEDSMVNWCPVLGTVLTNDEVRGGVSERGGHPVVSKKMKQWKLRMTAYMDRLLSGLDGLDWPTSIKETQRHWIGRSEGAEVIFRIDKSKGDALIAFTTRPETIFGVTYIALAPGHPYVKRFLDLSYEEIYKEELLRYQKRMAGLSERERMQSVDQVSGCFTGCYAIHPFTKSKIPIWVGSYVLEGYGTGVVMGVPGHDSRDRAFADHFSLPVIQVIEGEDGDGGKMVSSSFLNGLDVEAGREEAIRMIKKSGLGGACIGYRMRNPVFSRQLYWGEPTPIFYKGSVPHAMDERELPLQLPQVDDYRPKDGLAPLSRAVGWHTKEGYPIEYHTMPGWAGSSWYFFRYMDPHNEEVFSGEKAMDYWDSVDLYIGGSEHATGHLLYARFFTHFLYDRGYVKVKEPFKKLINQGMIQGVSHFVYRVKGTDQFVSYKYKEAYDTTPLRVDYTLIKKGFLDLAGFRRWRKDLADATFILEEGRYRCGQEVEKMSKSKHNAITPDEIIAQYGADVFRLYILFLGPITQSKPWNTEGIEGVARFVRKVWRLFHNEWGEVIPFDEGAASLGALHVIHTAIKQVREGIERYAFNTGVSGLMICVNGLSKLSCRHRGVLEDFLRLLAPFAPHIAEELWEVLGHSECILDGGMPEYDPSQLICREISYPVAIDGKKRTEICMDSERDERYIRQQVLIDPMVKKWMAGRVVKKIIVVPQKMINIVLEK